MVLQTINSWALKWMQLRSWDYDFARDCQYNVRMWCRRKANFISSQQLHAPGTSDVRIRLRMVYEYKLDSYQCPCADVIFTSLKKHWQLQFSYIAWHMTYHVCYSEIPFARSRRVFAHVSELLFIFEFARNLAINDMCAFLKPAACAVQSRVPECRSESERQWLHHDT